jgi:light-regulated signal transduction histidine kinase (bacteriophytochrome)
MRLYSSFAEIPSDLQAPLRLVSGFADLLARRSKGRLDAEADEFLDDISEAMARIGASSLRAGRCARAEPRLRFRVRGPKLGIVRPERHDRGQRSYH